MNYTNIFFNSLLHLIYPKCCAGCGSDLISGKHLICLECINELPLTDYFMHAGNPVEKIFWGRLPLVAAGSQVYFTRQSVIRNLLHQFKYRGNKEIGLYFGRMIGETLARAERFADVDGLIPLPLFYKKEKKRGYNQAAVICEGISEVMNVPVWGDVVARRKNTETQTHRSRMERWDNIEGKFELKKDHMIMDKHVLLVDDVITTGATLESCGTEILKAKGVRLSVASLAYTSL